MIDGAPSAVPERGVTGDLAPALARFGGTLRAHGIAATVRDEIDGVQALGLIDRDDRDEVRAALRIALKIPREAWTAYDRLFAAFWTGADLIEPPDLPPQPPPRERREPPRLLSWDPVRRRMSEPDEDADNPGGTREGTRPAASPQALASSQSVRRVGVDRAGAGGDGAHARAPGAPPGDLPQPALGAVGRHAGARPPAIRAAATGARWPPAARCCASRAASAPSRSRAWSFCATPAARWTRTRASC